MRTTALILGFGLVWMSLPVAAETASSGKAGASARPEARIGSLAPDEARRAERARRRAAEKNAKAAARDTKVTEGKSVAVPENKVAPATASVAPAAAAAVRPPLPKENVAPVKAAVAPSGTLAVPGPNQGATDEARGPDAGVRNAERARSGDREARAHERRGKRYAARHKAHGEQRYATDGSGDRRFSRQGMIVYNDPRGALPGAPPYPMAPRPREVFVMRAAPPPAYWGYGPPRAFYPAPGYMRDEPIDDVD